MWEEGFVYTNTHTHTFPGASVCCFTDANKKKNDGYVVEETVALNLTVSFILLSVFVWQRSVGAAEPAAGAASQQLRQISAQRDLHPGEKTRGNTLI